MSSENILCPGGESSQTGTAVRERYSRSSIANCGKIPDVPPQLDTNPGPYVIPIWNSHQGEVTAAEYVWDHIREAKIKITDLWAKQIEFWFIKRTTGGDARVKKIGSVTVAKTQCSGFLARQASELIERALTTIAFDEYRGGAMWDGVLVAPGQGENEPGFEVVSRETANPNNFTSFVRFVPSRSFTMDAEDARPWVTGVTMPGFGSTLGETEQAFFDALLSSIMDITDIPKLIFVLKRAANVGLIFEGGRLYSGDLLDAEDQERGEIEVYEAAGRLDSLYTNELGPLFAKSFPKLIEGDFILHRGVGTCLFVCPPLALYTHGYTVETVEPVVRFYISKLFQRWNEDAKCTEAQRKFFERHNEAWREKGSDFMEFNTVSATND